MKWLLCIALLLGSYLQLSAIGVPRSSQSIDNERLRALSDAEAAYRTYFSLKDRYDRHLKKLEKLVKKEQALRDEDQKEQNEITKLQGELAALITEKAEVLEEFRQGYFCSTCNRPKSVFERKAVGSFDVHIKEGASTGRKRVAATAKQIQDKSKEYDTKIQKLREKIQQKLERTGVASKKRWDRYNQERAEFYEEKRELEAALRSSSREYSKAIKQYKSRTIDADAIFKSELENELKQRMSQAASDFKSRKNTAFRSQMDTMRERVKAGDIGTVADGITELKAMVSGWQAEYSDIDARHYLQITQLSQTAREEDRRREAARAAKVAITSPQYTALSLVEPRKDALDLSSYHAAIASLDNDKYTLEFAASATAALDFNTMVWSGLRDKLRRRGGQIYDFLSEAGTSIRDTYREQVAKKNKLIQDLKDAYQDIQDLFDFDKILKNP